MADSLREYIKTRGADGRVWFLRPLEGVPVTTTLTLSAPSPAASFAEKPYAAILDYVTLLDTSNGAWHMRVSAAGAIETLEADVGGLTMAGYGVFGLRLRGATLNVFDYTVSVAGVITIANTPAPNNDIINPDYVDGSSRVAFCRQHNLAYRPDARIVYGSATHCPVDGARLRSWRDLVRDRQGSEDAASRPAYDDERW